MILQSLHALYDRLSQDPAYGTAAPGYSTQNVSFSVVLTPEGQLHGFSDEQVDQTISGPRGKEKIVRKSKQLRLPGQAKDTGSGINPCFLWDNTKYMLGYAPKDEKPERTRQSFVAFRERHLKVEKEIADPGFSAICRFLEDWSPEKATDYPMLAEQSGGFGVFRFQAGEGYIHERPLIRQWWNNQQTDTLENSGHRGMCLISGQNNLPIALTHKPKIKGVKNAQSTGSLLVSFNCDTFTSYDKTQSSNAPVSEEATFRYCTALNELLNGPKREKHRLRLANDTVVFWTERKTIAEEGISFLFSGAEEDSEEKETPEAGDHVTLGNIKTFLRALREGSAVLEGEQSVPFYILGLSPNAGRISVRFWHVSTLGAFLERLRDHFAALNIVRSQKDKEFPTAWMLLRETARESKDVAPLLEGALMRAILNGRPYPDTLAAAVIRRVRADHKINHLRAALLKAWLTRSPRWKGVINVSLDSTRTDPAYRLGRLFAALEKTQEEALPGLNATIRDRYYGAASATPATVFPRLLRTYQHHLSKLSVGAKVNREKIVQEIVGGVANIPSTLPLEEQGLFAIGYYHQRQDFFTHKGDKNTADVNHSQNL